MLNEKWNVLGASRLTSHGRGQIVCEQVGCILHFTDHNDTSGGTNVINRRGRASCRLHRGRQDIGGVRASSSCSIDKQTKLIEQWNDVHLMGNSKRGEEHLLAVRG